MEGSLSATEFVNNTVTKSLLNCLQFHVNIHELRSAFSVGAYFSSVGPGTLRSKRWTSVPGVENLKEGKKLDTSKYRGV